MFDDIPKSISIFIATPIAISISIIIIELARLILELKPENIRTKLLYLLGYDECPHSLHSDRWIWELHQRSSWNSRISSRIDANLEKQVNTYD